MFLILVAVVIYTYAIGYPFARAMVKYASTNNNPIYNNTENTLESLNDEWAELKEAIQAKRWKEVVLEYGDVLNSFMKHVLPYSMLVNPIVWCLAAFINPFCAYKLSRRAYETGCIRNHRKYAHITHSCQLTAKKLQIYYGSAVTNGVSSSATWQIELLQQYGQVLTNNIAAVDVDEGRTNDDIFERDMKLLAASDVMIADVTRPSTGTGVAIAYALHLNKPVLCLYSSEKVSALLGGNHSVDKAHYDTPLDAATAIRQFLLAHKSQLSHVSFPKTQILIVGPPGAGKSEAGKAITSHFPVPSISTGQLLRDRDPGPEIKALMDAGQLIPANTMLSILDKRLAEDDASTFGYVIDGYPASPDNVEAYSSRYKPDLIIYLECSTDECANRIVNRGQRASDNAETAKARVERFRMTYEDYKKAFPRTNIFKISSAASKEATAKRIVSAVESCLGFTSRFHVHVDGENTSTLRRFIDYAEQVNPDVRGRFELTKVRDLHLGPQVKSSFEYKKMPNFHSINNAKDEAFLTLKMGETYDDSIMKTLLWCAQTSPIKYTVELEEYLSKHTLRGDQIIRKRQYFPVPRVEGNNLVVHNQPNHIKHSTMELHLGFDLPRTPEQTEPPVDLQKLETALTEHGLCNGGWFIFDDSHMWQYRSNQFSEIDPKQAKESVKGHSRVLQEVLKKLGFENVDVGTSTEWVHGIWNFYDKK